MDQTRSKKSVHPRPSRIQAPPRRGFSSLALLLSTVLGAGCAATHTATETETAADPAPAVASKATPTPAVVIRDANGAPLDLAHHPDIWARIRAGLAMPKLDSPLVARHEQWFANNPEFMQAMTERAGMYLYYIVEEVEKRGMPMEIALLPAIESAYKPYAYSRAKAAGLWQFIAPTGRHYGLKMNWWYDGRRDVEAATRAALDYLEKLRDDFQGDWHLALAAYNAGEGKVSRMIEYNRRRGQPTTYEHLKLRAETKNYVPRLQAFVNIVAEPEKYGIELVSIPNKPYFARVETGSQIDIGVVARLADVDVDHLHKINPGFNRWATDPDGPHSLLVPVDKKELIEEALNNLPEEERVQYRHHQVVRGDTLSRISHRYRISVDALRTTNRLRSNFLRVGQNLLIPLSQRPISPAVASQTRGRTFAASARTARGDRPVIHRVRSGDTLWGIARRYNVLVRQLREWNLMDVGDVLRLGQRLKIWPGRSPSAAADHELPSG